MNIFVWVLQVLLGLQFVFHSYLLGVRHEQLQVQRGMGWIGILPGGLRTFIALSELLGGLGLILPAALGIVPWLTPLAAVGLAVIMASAIAFHVPRREYRNIVLNFILMILAAFVAYGRWNLLA